MQIAYPSSCVPAPTWGVARFLRLACAALLMSVDAWHGSASATVLALYDFEYGTPGRINSFNHPDFDSVDSEPSTDASRLFRGPGLNGGGSGHLLSNALFDPSDSGSPGLNVANVMALSYAAANSEGDYFEFTITPLTGRAYVYHSLSFFTDSYNAEPVSIYLSRDGQLLGSTLTPAGTNAPVEKRLIDFSNFVSTDPVTFHITIFGASSSLYGVRFDDITLNGVAVPEPSSCLLLLIGIGGCCLLSRRRGHDARLAEKSIV